MPTGAPISSRSRASSFPIARALSGQFRSSDACHRQGAVRGTAGRLGRRWPHGPALHRRRNKTMVRRRSTGGGRRPAVDRHQRTNFDRVVRTRRRRRRIGGPRLPRRQRRQPSRVPTARGAGRAGGPGDAFTDGFGMQQAPSYASITRSSYTRSNDAIFPEVDFQAPLYVVTQFSATDGTGGTYRNTFQYYGARLHLQGRGFEGFESQRIEDTRNGRVTIDYVHRQFPYTGMHIQRNIYQADATTRLGTWTVTQRRRPSASGAERASVSVRRGDIGRAFEAGGMLNGVLVTESNTTFTYADGYGNPTQVQKTTTDKDPYSPFFNSSWQPPPNYANDAATWCIGLPASSVTTAAAPGQPAASRTPRMCRIRPRAASRSRRLSRVPRDEGHDDVRLRRVRQRRNVRVVGASPKAPRCPPRTTRSGTATAANCSNRRPTRSATPPVMPMTTTSAFRYGRPTRTDSPPPGSMTNSEVHARNSTRSDKDRLAYESCASGPCWSVGDLRFLSYETELAADGSTIRSLQYFYDGYERLRSREFHRALGTWTPRGVHYDSAGPPCASPGPIPVTPNGHTRAATTPGRLTAQREFDGAAHWPATTLAYAGRTTSITDPLGRAHAHVADVAGRLRAHRTLARRHDPLQLRLASAI